MAERTPYDTGARLEPKVWVQDGVTSPDGRARPAEAEDYGRVDFDADDGTTLVTLHLQPYEHGLEMRVDQHTDDYLRVVGANEPPRLESDANELDAAYRERQMMLLHEGLHALGREFDEHVFFYDEGDPFAFDPGNYVFMPAAGPNGTCFAIEERFARGDDWEDPDRVPIGWSWVEDGFARMPDGSMQYRRQAEGTTIPSDIDRLIDRARAWCAEHSERAAAEEAAVREVMRARREASFHTLRRPDGPDRT